LDATSSKGPQNHHAIIGDHDIIEGKLQHPAGDGFLQAAEAGDPEAAP
jgi:hypothetical protein